MIVSKYPFIKQEGIKDCGVACLLMIIKYYNGFIPLEKLRDLTNTTKLGVSAYDLCEGAKHIGFTAEGLKITIDKLDSDEIFLPCIAHVTINNYNHYVVIYKINYKHKYLIIGDPASKVKKVTFEEFLSMWNGVIINLYPNRTIPIENEESIISFILKYIKHAKKLIINILLLSILVTIFACISSFYFRFLIDNINTSKNYLFYIFIIFITISFLKLINSYFRNKLVIYLSEKLDINMSCDVYNKIIDLPYQYYRNRTTGEIVSRFNDLNVVKDVITKIILSIFLDLPLTIFCLVISFTINLNLGLILFGLVLLYVLVTLIFNPIISKYINKLQRQNENNSSVIVESISGFESLKNLNIMNRFKKIFEDKYYKFVKTKFKFENIINSKQIISDLILDIGTLIILYLGTINVFDNKFSIGVLLMFYTLNTYVIDGIKNILNLNIDYKEAKNSLKRVTQMFMENKDLGVNNKFKCGNILIKNLNYSYRGDVDVLKHINLKINKGDKVLITGSSGSGKSTLLKIIKKYYELSNNNVFIDNIDLNYYTKTSIDKNIKYISQNEMLFSDTLLNNLSLYEKKDVAEIAKLCEIDQIMNKHNINFNYILEENGFNLSGGERQRIILGRALLQDFEILLIDEGLSQMDVNLERRILKRLFKKYSDKTIIVVSHRLDNLELYNHYIELSHGKIVKDVNKNE